MEWLNSKFRYLDTEETTSFGIELDKSSESRHNGEMGRPDADLVEELKERIAKYAMPTNNESTSPLVLRMLERSLSTLHELSEDREDCSSAVVSFFADETARIGADHSIADRSPKAPNWKIPRLMIEELNPEELVNGLFSSPSAPLSRSTTSGDERDSDTRSTALLPPLPKKPTPPSRARRKSRHLSSNEALNAETMTFEEFQDEPRRIGGSRGGEREEGHTRSHSSHSMRHRSGEDPESPPEFRLLADGFRLRILN